VVSISHHLGCFTSLSHLACPYPRPGAVRSSPLHIVALPTGLESGDWSLPKHVKNLWAIGGGNGCAGSAAHEEKTHGDMTHDMHLQLQA